MEPWNTVDLGSWFAPKLEGELAVRAVVEHFDELHLFISQCFLVEKDEHRLEELNEALKWSALQVLTILDETESLKDFDCEEKLSSLASNIDQLAGELDKRSETLAFMVLQLDSLELILKAARTHMFTKGSFREGLLDSQVEVIELLTETRLVKALASERVFSYGKLEREFEEARTTFTEIKAMLNGEHGF